MTEPAYVWQCYDPNVAPASCDYGDCRGAPAVMRGPRSSLIRLPWRAYCRTHASLYGVLLRRGRVVTRVGRSAA